MFRRVTVYGVAALAMLVLSPAPAPGASKEILELQRDVATLQDMVKSMQRSQDERFAALQVLVQQSVNASNEASRAVAVIQSSLQQNLRDQESKVVTPVVSLGSRMDQLSNDVRTMGQAMSDLTGMISRLQAQLTDLNNAVKVMQSPAAAPPPSGAGAPGAPMGGPGAEACGGSSTSLYENANRDRLGGKLDLALQEYADYLRCFSNTDLAPNAQYYIASIHYSQNDFEGAVRDFDTVLEKYGDTNKTPDAMFGKGQALVKMGRRTDGARQFQDLIKKYPKSDFAGKACDQLKGMGLSCGLRAAAPAKGTARKKK